MGTQPLSFVDQAFLLFETQASPKHIGGLLVFKKPVGAKRSYAHDLFEELASHSEAIPPFNLVLSLSLRAGYCWNETDDLDMEDHVFYHKLPARTSPEALMDFVGELHTPPLDRSRPLWEAHIIDGLEGSQFALYTKIHHAYGDGMSFTKLVAESLPAKPTGELKKVFWNCGHPFHYGRPKGVSFAKQVRGTLKMLGAPARILIGLNRISLLLWLEQFGVTKNAIAVPFTSRASKLTGQVTAGRQLACASVSMDRIAALRKRTRSTLNHVALTCVDGGLRRYLAEIDSPIDKPITIQMPVNLRTSEDEAGGNKIGIVLVELSPETDDPYVRLREIGVALRNVRHQVDTLPNTGIVAYGVLINSVAQIAETLGVSNWLPPLGNTLVSNVPGPSQTLYLKDAELTEYYPVSALPPGLHLNITLFSYGGKLNFGLIATKDALPELHQLSRHIEEAFTELEQAIDWKPGKSANGKTTSAPTKRKRPRKAAPTSAKKN